MIKWLTILALLVAVIVPHEVMAHSGKHAHELTVTVSHDGLEADRKDHTEAPFCCDAAFGGCVTAVLPHRSVAWRTSKDIAAKHAPLAGGLTGGIDLSFDPPPPRV